MTAHRSPRFAVAVLNWLHIDQSLIGDLLEEYESRGSRLWLWKQVLVAMFFGLSGRAQETGPHRRRDVELSAAPPGAPVGGVGLLALAVLIAIVRPGAFWFAAIALAGGIVIGAAMIFANRRRTMRMSGGGRRNIVTP